MATLKDHQQAMVDLLASGSGIPASASRLAHAMHDVLEVIAGSELMLSSDMAERLFDDATTPGLNDKALAGDLEACRPKATPAERRVKELENTVKQLREVSRASRDERIKELENTVKQLRASNAELKVAKQAAEGKVYELEGKLKETEQLWRNSDRVRIEKTHLLSLEKATVRQLQEQLAEQAGCRKDDTQVCLHESAFYIGDECPDCGEILK